MPSCSAQGCASRSDKGELLIVFPRKDWRRRQIWIDRVNRPGWTPTKYSALCERHFDRDQWELPREDGKRKLKITAVPSIFCVQHPAKNDLVAQDHAYCVLGYKQLYNSSSDNDTSVEEEEKSSTIPIEHIKLEVDEQECFSEEVVEDVEDDIVVDDNEDVENIQCTPDIFLMSEQNEPDPIETVHCEQDDVDSFTNDPSQDPLAISSEDLEISNKTMPNFSHSTKYLFVPKDTKVVTKLPPVVQGEPVVTTSSAIISSPTSQRPFVPNLPIMLSPPKLLNGKKVLFKDIKSALRLSNKLWALKSPTKLTLPKLTPSPQLLKLSMSNRLKLPKLTPISKLVSLSPQKGSIPKLTKIVKPLNVSLVKDSSLLDKSRVANSSEQLPPMLKLMPTSKSSSPLKLKMVSQSLFNPKLTCPSSNSSTSSSTVRKKVVARRTYEKAPEYLHAKNNNNNQFVFLTDQLEGSQQSPTNYDNPNKKTNWMSNHLDLTDEGKMYSSVRIQNNRCNVAINSTNDSSKIQTIFSEHKYTKKLPKESCPIDEKEMVFNNETMGLEKNSSVLFGNNHVKMWLKQKSSAKNKTGSSSTSPTNRNCTPKTKVPFTPDLISKLKSMSPTKASSVVVLKPFDKSDACEPLYLNNKSLTQRRHLDLYECHICKFSSLSSSSLQVHMTVHKDLVSSEEENHLTESFKIRENTKIIKRAKRTLKDKKISNCYKKNGSNKKSSGNQRNKNSVVLIDNSNALKYSKDEEFIRLSNLVSTVHTDNLNGEGNQTLANNFDSKFKHSSDHTDEEYCESGSEQDSKSPKSEELKSKGTLIDESGRRFSLRKKTKSFKSKLSNAVKSKIMQRNTTSSVVIKKNPVVLLSKFDINTANSGKPTTNSLSTKSITKIHDNNPEGWKGWDISEAKHDVDKDKPAIFLVGDGKNSTQSDIKVESHVKISTKTLAKGRKSSQVTEKKVAESNSKTSKSTKQKKTDLINGNLQCPTCKLFFQKEKLKIHVLLHDKSEYTCKLCSKKFDKSFLLRRHVLRDHKVEKSFSCQRRDCSRKFESRRELDKHVRSHRGPLPPPNHRQAPPLNHGASRDRAEKPRIKLGH